MHNYKKSGFTLVELIVVITILAVLATVGFISFQWYSSTSRDSVRLSEIKNISKAFEITRTKWLSLPMPENYTEISYSWSALQYQWNLTDKVLNKVEIFDGGEDPQSYLPYTITINAQKNKFQILGFFENYESIVFHNTVSADNSDLFYKLFWDRIWIFIEPDTNIPVTSVDSSKIIDIASTNENFKVLLDSQLELEWNNTQLTSLVTLNDDFTSCSDILNNIETAVDWYYFITNDTLKEKVYCDMSTSNWGWTAVANISKWWTIWWDESIWENDTVFWDVNNYNSQDYKNFYYQNIWKDIMYITDSWAKIFFNDCLIDRSLPGIFSNTSWENIENLDGTYYWFRCEMSGWTQAGLWNYLNFKIYDKSQWSAHGKSMLSSISKTEWMVFWYSWIWVTYTNRHDNPTNIIETRNWDSQYTTDFWHSARNVNNVTIFIR